MIIPLHVQNVVLPRNTELKEKDCQDICLVLKIMFVIIVTKGIQLLSFRFFGNFLYNF
jgi:hypothetical protein